MGRSRRAWAGLGLCPGGRREPWRAVGRAPAHPGPELPVSPTLAWATWGWQCPCLAHPTPWPPGPLQGWGSGRRDAEKQGGHHGQGAVTSLLGGLESESLPPILPLTQTPGVPRQGKCSSLLRPTQAEAMFPLQAWPHRAGRSCPWRRGSGAPLWEGRGRGPEAATGRRRVGPQAAPNPSARS